MNCSDFNRVLTQRRAARALIAAAALVIAAGASAQPQLIQIYYPGTTNDPWGMRPQCISGDGTTVFGDTSLHQVFVWTQAAGSAFLPDGGAVQLHINAASYTGARAAGRTSVSSLGRAPMLWENRQRILLRYTPEGGQVLGMNADGSMLVGELGATTPSGWYHAAKWPTQNSFFMIDDGLWYKSAATDVSANGTHIVGWCLPTSTTNDRQLFLHTASGTSTIDPPLDFTFPFPRPYSALSEAIFITDDASTIIAQWQQPGTGWNRVFKYTISSGQWNSIGLPPNEVSVLMTAANADGSMIAGHIQRQQQFIAAFWTQQAGWIGLNQFLIGEGMPRLTDPIVITGVSDDRLALCAQTGEGWSWVVRFDTACRADYDRSGTLDFTDYLAFVQDWLQELPAADFNRDRTIDFFDYLDYVAAFDAGC
jgi:uncharacterized membrane protein